MSTAEAITESVDYESLAHDKLFEVVNGEVVEQPPMGAYSEVLALELYDLLQQFVKAHRLGRAFTETRFVLHPEPRLERRPDVAFVSRVRLRGQRLPKRGAFELVPDLAVEVLSPTNQSIDIDAKVLEYFDAGVQLVWVLYPETRRMYIYASRNDLRVVDEQDTIEAGELLPGFSMRLADVFAAVDELS